LLFEVLILCLSFLVLLGVLSDIASQELILLIKALNVSSKDLLSEVMLAQGHLNQVGIGFVLKENG